MSQKDPEARPAAPARKAETPAGRAERHLASLAALAENLQNASDAADAARAFIECIGGSSAVSRAALYLAPAPGASFEPRESFRMAEAASLPPIGASSPFARWIARAGASTSIDEFFTSGGARDEDEAFLAPLVAAGCSMAAPLLFGGTLAGVLAYAPARVDAADRDDGAARDRFLRAASSLLAASLHGAEASRALARVERAAAAKRDALDGACRELRSALRMLGSALSSLESDDVSDMVLVDMARGSVSRLEETASFALALNGVDADAPPAELERIEARSLVDDALREAIPELEEKDITVETRDDTAFRAVRVDREAMATALRCVLGGVIALVPRGGTVTVSLDLAVDGEDAGDGIAIASRIGDGSPGGRGAQSRGETLARVSIGGTGIVLPGVDADAFADPLATAAASSDGRARSLAVALAVAGSIVARHDGIFTATYDAGRVARFTMRLPVVE